MPCSSCKCISRNNGASGELQQNSAGRIKTLPKLLVEISILAYYEQLLEFPCMHWCLTCKAAPEAAHGMDPSLNAIFLASGLLLLTGKERGRVEMAERLVQGKYRQQS